MIGNQMSSSLRWSFYLPSWRPTSNEWTFCCQCIQDEERKRINQFVYKRDAIASMAGRLMLRKAASEIFGLHYKEINLGRSEKGKPFINNSLPSTYLFDFNVSHHGDYCVLAAEMNSKVGIDIMKTGYTGRNSVNDYFNMMKRQLTSEEWDYVGLPGLQTEQLKRFYRLWSLKESYVKAVGIGVGYSLQRLCFHCLSPALHVGVMTVDTELYIDGNKATDWNFQETLLDEEHCIAVAVSKIPENRPKCDTITNFEVLSFQDLIKNAETLTEQSFTYGDEFSKKPESPNCK